MNSEKIATLIRAEAERNFPSLVQLQRDFHEHPELGFEERRTAAIVAREMEEIGLSVRTGVAETGLTADLAGAVEGSAVALRVDMDALPIEEDGDLPWRSRVPGVAHVCGHDAHTAIGIGVARVLAAVRQYLPGTVRFIFQPAEERPVVAEEGERPYLEGAKAVPAAELMIRDGVLEDPPISATFGLHLWPWLEAGVIGVEDGAAMAGAANFVASIYGRSAHGAAPEDGVDSILAVAQVLNMMQLIVSRQKPAAEPLVITVGTIRGGARRNVIADRVDITGTVRGLSGRLLRDVVPVRMKKIFEAVCTSLDASYELEYYPLLMPVMNDPELAASTREAIRKTLGAKAVTASLSKAMTSEDYSCFTQRVPGVHLKIGCTPPGAPAVPLHNRSFTFDEAAIRSGVVAAAAAIAWKLIEGGETNGR